MSNLVDQFDHDLDNGNVGDFLGAFTKMQKRETTRDNTETTVDDTSIGSFEELVVKEVPSVQSQVSSIVEEAVDEDEEDSDDEEGVTMSKIIVLISSQSANRNVLKDQTRATSVLDYVGVEYVTLDGSDATQKEARDDLFELSERRGEYPQFFQAVGEEIGFLGGMKEFESSTDSGNFGDWLLAFE